MFFYVLQNIFLTVCGIGRPPSSQKVSRHPSGIHGNINSSEENDGEVILDVFSVPEQDRAK